MYRLVPTDNPQVWRTEQLRAGQWIRREDYTGNRGNAALHLAEFVKRDCRRKRRVPPPIYAECPKRAPKHKHCCC